MEFLIFIPSLSRSQSTGIELINSSILFQSMLFKNLIYKNGHFYDTLNGTRIGFKDDAKISIKAASSDLISFLPCGTYPLQIKERKVLEASLKSDKTISKYTLVKKRGELLYFYVNHRKEGAEIHHEFEVELLEDLYMFIKGKWKIQEGRLYDCACVVRKILTNSIDFFEVVYAESLNEVYKNTFVHYFGNEGNPACNAIDRFYEAPGCEKLALRKYRKF